MKHVHEKTGMEFEVGKLEGFNGTTYDICVITKWTEDETNPITFVNYYFGGEYDKDTTDHYIDQYLEQQSRLKDGLKFLEGEYLINCIDGDFMKPEEKEKLKNSIDTLTMMI